MYDQEITLSDDLTDEEIIHMISKLYMEKWKTSYDYQNVEPIVFKSKTIDRKILTNTVFMATSYYITYLTSTMLSFKFNKLEEWARREIREWDRRGGLCIYLSVLNWCLLYETRIVKEENLKLIQGFYKHPTHGILSLLSEGEIIQSGLHAFITIDDAIVDFSISQEECCFDFGEYSFIIGEIPNGMYLGGWPEGKEIVKKYAREIARFSNMNYYEWINNHQQYSYEIALKGIKKDVKVGLKNG